MVCMAHVNSSFCNDEFNEILGEASKSSSGYRQTSWPRSKWSTSWPTNYFFIIFFEADERSAIVEEKCA